MSDIAGFCYYKQQIWSLKDSTGPLHAKRASSSLAAVAWDPTGYGYYYAEAETTSVSGLSTVSVSFILHRVVVQDVLKFFTSTLC